MNGRRGAGRSDADRLPARRKPSKGEAHRGIPRTVRGGRSIARSGEHQRTTRDQPGEPQIWCQLKHAGGQERSKPSRWWKPRGRNESGGGNLPTEAEQRPAEWRHDAGTGPSGSGRSWRDPEEGREEGREVPREETEPGRPGEVDGSGQDAGDDATGEAVNRDRKTPERAWARESTRWPSETTNHGVGQSGRPTTDT